LRYPEMGDVTPIRMPPSEKNDVSSSMPFLLYCHDSLYNGIVCRLIERSMKSGRAK